MGNSQQEQHVAKPSQNQKLFLELRHREIILDFQQRVKVIIGDIDFFPSGFEGLHLWDSNIILARYILKNKEIFSHKTVI